jgi:hypothetical protein
MIDFNFDLVLDWKRTGLGWNSIGRAASGLDKFSWLGNRVHTEAREKALFLTMPPQSKGDANKSRGLFPCAVSSR